MNRFYIITNSEKDRGLKTTGEIHDYLKARGCQCVVREYQGQEELPQGLCVVAVPEVQIIPVQACHFYPLIDPEGKKEEYPQSEEVFHPEKPFLLFIHCCKFLFPL